jgi:hypothetical protein
VRRDGKVFFSYYDVDLDKEVTMFDLTTNTAHYHGRQIHHLRQQRGDGEMYIVKLETGEVKILCYQKMSWERKMSRFHPHVTVSYTTNQAIFTTDCYGKPGVFIADIPTF